MSRGISQQDKHNVDDMALFMVRCRAKMGSEE